MTAATLRQEAYEKIDLLPDDSLKLVVELLRKLKPNDAAEPPSEARRHAGALKGGLHYMSDDFDETPDCFEGYL